ncbi:MAG: hypothetical protein ACTSXP_08380 [Promethearchaeota archaeon]
MLNNNDISSTGNLNTSRDIWKNPEFEPLLNRNEMQKIARNDPWRYEIASKLRDIIFRMELQKSINFRLSGIILHSASWLLKEKSESIIDTGNKIQDNLSESEDAIVNGDKSQDNNNSMDCLDIFNEREKGNLLSRGGCPGDINPSGPRVRIPNDFDSIIEVLAKGKDPASKALIHNRLQHFYVPRRITAKPLTLSDLSTAFNDVVRRKYKRKLNKKEIKKVTLPDSIKNQYGDELKIEHIISRLTERIADSFKSTRKPISFSDLLPAGKKVEKIGVVIIIKSFLAILQMLNKKIIKAWQEDDGQIYIAPYDSDFPPVEDPDGIS